MFLEIISGFISSNFRRPFRVKYRRILEIPGGGKSLWRDYPCKAFDAFCIFPLAGIQPER